MKTSSCCLAVVLACMTCAVVQAQKVVVMGASTDGPPTINHILTSLPYETAARNKLPAVLIVQHAIAALEQQWIDAVGAANICMATQGQLIVNGRVYVAPYDKHMRILVNGTVRTIDLTSSGVTPEMAGVYPGGNGQGYRPSINPLFSSAAALGGDALGIQLTGAGYDGAVGLLRLHIGGGSTLAQAELTGQFAQYKFGFAQDMPEAAAALFASFPNQARPNAPGGSHSWDDWDSQGPFGLRQLIHPPGMRWSEFEGCNPTRLTPLKRAVLTRIADKILSFVPELRGDANLDGHFNSADITLVNQAGQYEDGIPQNSVWATGDWNADGDFTSADWLTVDFSRYEQ